MFFLNSQKKYELMGLIYRCNSYYKVDYKLSRSWMAILLTAVSVLKSSRVRRNFKGEGNLPKFKKVDFTQTVIYKKWYKARESCQ